MEMIRNHFSGIYVLLFTGSMKASEFLLLWTSTSLETWDWLMVLGSGFPIQVSVCRYLVRFVLFLSFNI